MEVFEIDFYLIIKMRKFSFKGCREKKYETNEFHRIDYEIDITIDALTKLVITCEISATEYEVEIKEKFGYDENGGWGCADEEIDTLYEYRNIQRNAIFLMAYSFYEGKFKEITKLYSNKINENKKLKYPKGFWDYIKNKCQINEMSDIQLKYNFLEMLWKIRNSITHSSSTISSSDIKQRLTVQEIAKLQNLGFSFRFTPQKENYNYLVFKIADNQFFDYLFKQIEEFFDFLMIEIDSKLGSLKQENN